MNSKCNSMADRLDPGKGAMTMRFAHGRHGTPPARSPHWVVAGQRRQAPCYLSGYAQARSAEACTDRLTGLTNRCGLLQLLGSAIDQAGKTCCTLSLLLLDIDNFKQINDALGPRKGDALLDAVGRRLRALGPGIGIGRFAGDQFMLLLPAGLAPALVAERARLALRHPIDIGTDCVELQASIGSCSFPADGTDAATLVANVETALNHAKQNGRDAVSVFRPEMTGDVRRRRFLEAQLRLAIRSDALELVYQPQFDCASGRMIGMEALVRWHHPQCGALSPAEFIPVAEKTALIVALGEWVAERACTQIAALNRQTGHSLPVGINVSARQFGDPAYPSQVAALLERTGLAPACLELELTEGMLMQDVDSAVLSMTALRRLGVRLAIDDFGTGYSSLAYLRHFPINRLKIDRSFIATLPQENQPLARALVALGHACNLEVLAEGVETRAQFAWLALAGCDAGQGFWLAGPMCYGDLRTYVLDGAGAGSGGTPC